ncbi:hypothetical protein Taro_026499, partial [Colocasia esculenta]|nr:hypothetical protein [Colocasia esculenta]
IGSQREKQETAEQSEQVSLDEEEEGGEGEGRQLPNLMKGGSFFRSPQARTLPFVLAEGFDQVWERRVASPGGGDEACSPVFRRVAVCPRLERGSIKVDTPERIRIRNKADRVGPDTSDPICCSRKKARAARGRSIPPPSTNVQKSAGGGRRSPAGRRKQSRRILRGFPRRLPPPTITSGVSTALLCRGGTGARGFLARSPSFSSLLLGVQETLIFHRHQI